MDTTVTPVVDEGLGSSAYLVDLGGLTLRTLATPGHTPEHVASQLLDGALTLGVFTGGSLIVGSAARTDLVSPDRTEELARAQYRSIHRLAELDDAVAAWPTHGAGSFCSSPPGAERTSTIGAQRATNALLRAVSEDDFVPQLLAWLGRYPPYSRVLGELNRHGPALVQGDTLTALAVGDVVGLIAHGAAAVDVCPIPDFGAGHVPGSVSIPLRPEFGTRLGWLIPSGRRLVIVRGTDQDPAEVLWQARKIGYDDVAELAGGIAAWAAAGHPNRNHSRGRSRCRRGSQGARHPRARRALRRPRPRRRTPGARRATSRSATPSSRGAGTAMVYPTLLAAIGDVAHPIWRARSVGVYGLWRDGGFAVGALLAGVIADAVGVRAAVWVVVVLTAASGLVVAARMYETLRPGPDHGTPDHDTPDQDR